MANIIPHEFDEDFTKVYDTDGKNKAQPIKSKPQSCIVFNDSDEKASMLLVAVESPAPTLHIHVELRAVFNCGKERKVATLAFSQQNLECVGAELVDGLKLKARFFDGKSVRLEAKKDETFEYECSVTGKRRKTNFEYQCAVNRDHVSKLFKEVPFWETEERNMTDYNKWWKKAMDHLKY